MIKGRNETTLEHVFKSFLCIVIKNTSPAFSHQTKESNQIIAILFLSPPSPFSFSLQLFRVLDIRIAVVHVITWTQGNQINVVSDSNTLLDNFRDYVPQVTTPHDALMLLT